MLIIYENDWIKELFSDISDVSNSKNLLQKKVGKERAFAAKKRKLQIEAATNFMSYLNLRIGKPHCLSGDLSGYYAIDINAHTRLIIKPQSEDLSPEALAKCDTVILKGIIEYHGGKNEWLIP